MDITTSQAGKSTVCYVPSAESTGRCFTLYSNEYWTPHWTHNPSDTHPSLLMKLIIIVWRVNTLTADFLLANIMPAVLAGGVSGSHFGLCSEEGRLVAIKGKTEHCPTRCLTKVRTNHFNILSWFPYIPWSTSVHLLLVLCCTTQALWDRNCAALTTEGFQAMTGAPGNYHSMNNVGEEWSQRQPKFES